MGISKERGPFRGDPHPRVGRSSSYRADGRQYDIAVQKVVDM